MSPGAGGTREAGPDHPGLGRGGVASRFVEAAKTYADYPIAHPVAGDEHHLRDDQGTGSTILIPTGMVDTMNPLQPLCWQAWPLPTREGFPQGRGMNPGVAPALEGRRRASKPGKDAMPLRYPGLRRRTRWRSHRVGSVGQRPRSVKNRDKSSYCSNGACRRSGISGV